MEKTAYVRLGFKSAKVEICTLETPLPEGLHQFGYVDGDCVGILTPKGRFAPAWIALDWLREQGWTVSPDVPQFADEEVRYITARTLKDRGWTPKLIEQHLPEPDKELDNPHYSSAPPMWVYAKARVSLIEKIPEVTEAIEKTLTKRNNMQQRRSQKAL